MKKISSYFLFMLGLGFLMVILGIEVRAAHRLNAFYENEVNIESKEAIVQSFCKLVLDPEWKQSFSSQLQEYESSESVFLAILCNNNGLHYKSSDQVENYLRTFSFKKNSLSACQKKYQEDCNLAQIWETIISQLFSELFTLRLAEIFWLSQETINDEDLLYQRINAYALEKFWIPKFCDHKIRSYAKTCDYMKKQMEVFIPTIQAFHFLESSKLYNAVKTKDNKKKSEFDLCKDPYKNYLLCWTLGATDNGLSSFVRLIYNELTRYTIFSTYTTQLLSQRATVSPEVYDEINQHKWNPSKFQSITNQSLGELAAIASSYPLHIWFLAYQEGLLRFRNDALSKIIPPFYSLYYKLRNVQSNN